MPLPPVPDSRLSMAPDLESRDGSLEKDAHITNGFTEVDGEQTVYMRPGLVLAQSASASPGQGLLASDANTILIVSGGTISIGP